MLTDDFFNKDPFKVAQKLLGKVIHVRYKRQWLKVQIIETEAYCHLDKASHASLGYTEKRKALFMAPGTIYMYYSRGADSLNISCRGKGNAVLIKSGIPYGLEDTEMIRTMQQLNPCRNGSRREPAHLCSGQTLLCKSLDLKVKDWDQKNFTSDGFYMADCGYRPNVLIQTRRLGIPEGRDEHLLYRFIDHRYALFCTQNPLTRRKWCEGIDYQLVRLKND